MSGHENQNEPPAPSPGREAGTVTLVKGRHRWTFACQEGEERSLLRCVAALAGREGVPFDWFDAALVSHQLGGRLRAGISRAERPAEPGGISGGHGEAERS